ncbi:MAG: substrate-binding periplasmic protein [Thermonemataceae bacterium]
MRLFVHYLCITFLLGLICITTLQAQLVADSWRNTEMNGKGTVIITYVEASSFVYKNEQEQLAGICVDILKEFIKYVYQTKAVKLNIQVVKENDDFNSFLTQVKSGRGGVLGLGPITMTNQRKEEMYFTPPFLDNLSVLVTHSSMPTLSSLNDISGIFKGLKAYALKNSTQEIELLEIKKKYFPALEIAYVDNADELISKVAEDPNAFTKIDYLFYIAAVKNGQTVKRHPIGDLRTKPLAFIMPYGCDWMPIWYEFMTGLEGFRNSTTYKKILVKHLGPEVTRTLLKLR